MATTRSAPLRARQPAPSLDGHPLGTLRVEPTPTPTSAASRRTADQPAFGASRVLVRRAAAGSLHSLDWRQAVGGGLVVLGMLGIIIAWFGVSGTLDPGEQMPYISSGGFGGAALIAVGVTLLISFEHSRDRDALAQVLDELDELRQRLDSQGAAGEQR
jgi:hypothetical protein